jgi:hypothetical protein
MDKRLNIMKKIYDNEWQNSKYQDTITISKSYFDSLLNCLIDQKNIRNFCQENREIIQEDIDINCKRGFFILKLQSEMELVYKTMVEKYCKIWNEAFPFISNCFNDDYKQYPEDLNISFKWNHLVSQEIEMWMRLCCFSDAIIDCEKCQYKHGVVSLNDFNYIIIRRGFTPKMISFLIDILKDIGIGEQLNHRNEGLLS